MLKLAKILILTMFVFCNFSYAATFNIEEGDEADALQEVFLDAIQMTNEEKRVLHGYHEDLKGEHHRNIDRGDYHIIHRSRSENGDVLSAIKFTHPQGKDIIYQIHIGKDLLGKVSLKDKTVRAFGLYAELKAFKEVKKRVENQTSNNDIALKAFRNARNEMLNAPTLSQKHPKHFKKRSSNILYILLNRPMGRQSPLTPSRKRSLNDGLSKKLLVSKGKPSVS